MKSRKKIALCLLSVMLLVAPHFAAEAETNVVTLKVRGMVCPFCALTVESVLKRTEGVIDADASFIKGEAVITYDPKQTSPEALMQILNTKTFYRASLPKNLKRNFKAGMALVALQFEKPFDPKRTRRIGVGLKKMKGVVDVNALSGGRVGVAFDPKLTSESEIIAQVERMGFPVMGGETLAGSQQ